MTGLFSGRPVRPTYIYMCIPTAILSTVQTTAVGINVCKKMDYSGLAVSSSLQSPLSINISNDIAECSRNHLRLRTWKMIDERLDNFSSSVNVPVNKNQ